MAAAWEPRLRLGTAIVPAYTRSPALFAQSVASLADAAPGRFAIGVGSSSNVIVERWNGVPFEEPYKKVRDVVRFLNDALGGEKVKQTYDTFEVNGFRLGIRPEQKPQILVAALREGMLRLAGREADGAIINWLSAGDVSTVAGIVNDAGGGDDKEIVCRIFCCPSENTEVGAGICAIRHRRVSRTCRCTPRSTSGWAVAMRCSGMWETGRRATERRRSPRSPTRWWTTSSCTDRPRSAAQDPGVLRQRGDDELAGDPPARPRTRSLAGGRDLSPSAG